MTKKALPGTDLDSILLYIFFAILIVLAIILAIHKIYASFAAHTGETLYPRPTWTESDQD